MPVKRKLSRGRPRTWSQSSPRTRGRPRLSKKSRVRRRRRSRSLNGGNAEDVNNLETDYPDEFRLLKKSTAETIKNKHSSIYTHAKKNPEYFPWAKEDKGTLLDLIFNNFFQWHYTEVDTLKSIITELKKIPNQDTNIKNLDFYSIQRNVNANLNISTNDQNFITNLLNNSK
jgi:ribosomal protein S18